MNKRTLRCLVPCFFLLMGLSQALATTVIPMNLADLVERSPRVFHGKCIKVSHDVTLDTDGVSEIPVTRYTFQVSDNLRGITQEKVVLSHLGYFTDGRRYFVNPDWLGIPKYRVGDSYILFLNANGNTGLCAPMGMTQGVFDVENAAVQNRAGNSHIMTGLAPALKGTAHMRLMDGSARTKQDGLMIEPLKALIRDLMSGKVKAQTRKEMSK